MGPKPSPDFGGKGKPLALSLIKQKFLSHLVYTPVKIPTMLPQLPVFVTDSNICLILTKISKLMVLLPERTEFNCHQLFFEQVKEFLSIQINNQKLTK
jgi:hypothetical protein